MSTVPGTSNSGITEDTDGTRFIPSSVRADGSTRKEIRVRPGYRPPEDVEVYKNRTAEAWRNRGKGAGIPGANLVSNVEEKKTETAAGGKSKNAKKRAAKKRAKESAANEAEKEGEDAEAVKKTETRKEAANVDNDKPALAIDSETSSMITTTFSSSTRIKPDLNEEEKEKHARAIRKKIRQATELKGRKENGENLLPEQLEKVIRITELTRQLKSLGFEE